MSCLDCGAQLNKKDDFCSSCGASNKARYELLFKKSLIYGIGGLGLALVSFLHGKYMPWPVGDSFGWVVGHFYFVIIGLSFALRALTLFFRGKRFKNRIP